MHKKEFCTCNKIGSALEHSLTCPVKSKYLCELFFMAHEEEIKTVQENIHIPWMEWNGKLNKSIFNLLTQEFKSYGYTPSVTPPIQAKYEMIQCKECLHWYPRWKCYECPNCGSSKYI